MNTENSEIDVIESKMDSLENTPSEIIEVGQRMIQSGFKVSVRDVCEYNDIKEGDIVVIYIKKTNIKSKKRN